MTEHLPDKVTTDNINNRFLICFDILYSIWHTAESVDLDSYSACVVEHVNSLNSIVKSPDSDP